MRANASRIATIVLAAATLAGCEAQCSVSTAKLSEETMASAINPDTKAPVTKAVTFAPDTGTIYATVKLSNAPEGTKVKATFHYLEGGDRQIFDYEMTSEGTRYIAFSLTRPTNGWPVGPYETRFLLNDKPGPKVPFNVAPSAASAATPNATPTKLFRDEAFGFSLSAPDTWTYRVTPRKDYLFEGPKGTDAYETSVIIQFVRKSDNPGSSAKAQLDGLAAELARAPNGAIGKRGEVNVGGQSSPFFNATYNAKTSTGVVAPFTHTQIAVDHGDYYYLISYSGPTPAFEAHLPVFEGMVTSFAFTPRLGD
ncbi:MAG: hypothetical protein EPO35_10550 [Acidobacteria bacterium]|nr:MAG: hypothetical protein EPO35_10550 [Acidobacteriota bacterium]